MGKTDPGLGLTTMTGGGPGISGGSYASRGRFCSNGGVRVCNFLLVGCQPSAFLFEQTANPCSARSATFEHFLSRSNAAPQQMPWLGHRFSRAAAGRWMKFFVARPLVLHPHHRRGSPIVLLPRLLQQFDGGH